MVILGGIGSITGVIVGATLVTLLNIQILQSFSLYLSALRQSDASILGMHWSHLSNQLDPAKYQRLIFGILLVVMMIYRPTGLLPAARRKRELGSKPDEEGLEEKGA
jgi:branched-chain amino acid transport system permease protein